MKRPLVIMAIADIIGIAAAELSSSYFFVTSSVILLMSVILAFADRRSKRFYLLSAALFFYSLGSFEFLYFDSINIGRYRDFGGQLVEIDGFVDSEPQVKENSISYVIKVKSVKCRDSGEKKGGRILLTTLKDDAKRLLDYGRQVNIRGSLELPKGARNPGGFDYRKYLARIGVSGLVFARYFSIVPGEGTGSNPLVSAGLSIRRRIVEVIEASLPAEQAGLLNGMLIGYRQGLEKDVQDAFSDAGLSHIMAVSGANVAFIVFPLVFVLKKLGIGRRIRNLLVICALILFLFITGAEPSVTRAVIMAVIILAGEIMTREGDVYTSISAAALLMLVCSPHILFNIGFQLSFSATLSLVLFYKNISEKLKFKYLPGIVRDTLSATLAAQAGVLPVSVLYFNKISLISLVSNVVVVPVLEIITILGSLMALLGQFSLLLSRLLGYINCTFLSLVLFTAKTSAELPYASVRVPTPSMLLIIVYYLILFLMLRYKPAPKDRIKPVCLIVLTAVSAVVISARLLIPGGLEVYFLDVGQGDSIFIRTERGKTVLIDGGGGGSGANIGDTTVIPFLLDAGVAGLDLVVATHAHDDHIQGLAPVLEAFGANCLALPDYPGNDEDFKSLLGSVKPEQISRLEKGDNIILDENTYFTVLNPDKNSGQKPTLNNSSLVLKLHYKSISVLFTGDIEKEAEGQLMEDGEDLYSDVLKVAHHGSDTSTGKEFLARINPASAVISVGKNNFGHPSALVLGTLEGAGVPYFRTDRCGALVLSSDGKKIKMVRTINESER